MSNGTGREKTPLPLFGICEYPRYLHPIRTDRPMKRTPGDRHITSTSREQLMQSIYGWEEDVDSNALEVHIHNLRKKLNANFIRTIRGVGYMAEKNDSVPLS